MLRVVSGPFKIVAASRVQRGPGREQPCGRRRHPCPLAAAHHRPFPSCQHNNDLAPFHIQSACPSMMCSLRMRESIKHQATPVSATKCKWRTNGVAERMTLKFTLASRQPPRSCQASSVHSSCPSAVYMLIFSSAILPFSVY